MSGAISPLEVRPKTAKKLVSESTINALSKLLYTVESGYVGLETKPEETIEGYRRMGPMFRLTRRPSFQEYRKIVKEELNGVMAELEKNINKSLGDNKNEKLIQLVFLVLLFAIGITTILVGIFQNRFDIIACGGFVEIFICYPINNLIKIRRENIFLNSLIPWIKANIIPCDLHENPKDVIECYQKGLRKLNAWMKQLQQGIKE